MVVTGGKLVAKSIILPPISTVLILNIQKRSLLNQQFKVKTVTIQFGSLP